ncbi:MAG: hypothetical protein OQK51_24390 [Kangiellaceae bacterium]|nr:hypothetical protein [Kangiellaceae bacterium]
MKSNNHGGARLGAGRPKDAINLRKLINEVISDEDKKDLIRKLLAISKDDKNKNQFNAIKELLAITLGKSRDAIEFEIVGDSLFSKAESILDACSRGEISTTDATSLIGSLRHLIELTDYDNLIDKLKEVIDERQNPSKLQRAG